MNMIPICLRTLCAALMTSSMILTVSAQCPGGWVRQGGGGDVDFGKSVAVDGSGNVYVTGSFAGAAVFSGVAITATDVHEDIFLAKYASDGTLLWIRSGGGPDLDWPGEVAVDGEGNAYITGTHFRPAAFGGINLPNGANQPNAFVVKYSPDGDVLWAITMGGDGWDSGDAIAYAAANGHVFVGGQFEGAGQFGDFPATAVSQRDLYIAELDASGEVVGLSLLEQTTGDEQVRGLTVGVDGSLYAVGAMNGTFNGWQVYTAAGAHDCMLLKFGPGPVLEWIRFGGGSADDLWNDVAVGPAGEVFVSGVVSANAVFGSETLAGAGDKDQVLAKYHANGDLEWIRSGGGPGIDAGGGVLALDNGHTLINGSFQGTATFEGTTINAGGDSDVLMIEYDAEGAAMSIAHWGAEGDNFGYGAAQGTDGAVYITGLFEGGMSIGDTAIQTSGGRDAFIHQVCDGSVGVTEAAGAPGLIVSPNPVVAGNPWTIELTRSMGPSLLMVCDAQGRRILEHRFRTAQGTCLIEGLAKGLYVVQLTYGQGGSSARLLVVE